MLSKMTDVILFGEPMAMFVADKTGKLENAETFTRSLAGAEVNVAIGLARMGYQVSYITKLGTDPFGNYIFTKLQQEKINTEHIIFDPFYPTGFQLKGRKITGESDVVYFRKNSAASNISRSDITKVNFETVRHVHLTGIPLALSEKTREVSYFILEKARKHTSSISFDPNLRPVLWNSTEEMVRETNRLACQCHIVLPGLEEGKVLTGYDTPEEIASFYRDRGVDVVIVKLGKEGAYLSSGNRSFYQSAWPVSKIVDTVGAGDGFAVGVLSGMLDHLSDEEMLRRANLIGALQLTVAGDNEGLPTREKLEQYLLSNISC